MYQNTHPADRTASAIIASITTSAMADPKFCTTNISVKKLLELLKCSDIPMTSHGNRERPLEIIKYGTRFLCLIGIQSDTILQAEFIYK
jgi:hypothetical protein